MAYIDSYTIRQGKITLYRRSDEGSKHQTASWYAKFKIQGEKPLRRSLKSSNQDEAELIAEDMFFDLSQKAQRGLSLNSKRFSLVAASFLEDSVSKVIEDEKLPYKDRTYKRNRFEHTELVINKFLIPYFGEKKLSDISDFDIDGFKDFRRTYWTTGDGSQDEFITFERGLQTIKRPRSSRERSEPNYGTVNKNLTILRKIFEFARMKRLIQGQEIPTITNLRRPKNLNDKKPGLTTNEVRHLTATLHIRYKEETNPKHRRHYKLLLHYIAFMSLTGIRVAEGKNLTFNDCKTYMKDGSQYLKIFVHGKGKSRELIGLDESSIVLEKLRVLHKEDAEKHGWVFTDDMNLFVNQYGKTQRNFSKSLNRAFEEAGLLYDAFGVKRSAGAFRKYYITQALLIGNVNYFELAKQCGNSVAVIEKYYAEIDVTNTPERFVFTNAMTGIYDEE